MAGDVVHDFVHFGCWILTSLVPGLGLGLGFRGVVGRSCLDAMLSSWLGFRCTPEPHFEPREDAHEDDAVLGSRKLME